MGSYVLLSTVAVESGTATAATAAVGLIGGLEVLTMVVGLGGITISVATADGSGVVMSPGSTVVLATGSKANAAPSSSVETSAD
jgi:hypothetical protein